VSKFGDAWQVLTGKKRATEPRKPGRRAYEGAAPGRLAGWNLPNTDPNAELSGGLEALRKASRDLDRNNPWGRRIIDAWVNALVADGIRPTIVLHTGKLDANGKPIRDREAESKVYDLWERWGRSPVAGSSMDIYGYQRALARSMLLDGDGLTRFRPRFPADMPGLPPLKLQLLESDLLPVSLTQTVGNSLNRIYCGIEYDAIGEKVAYHLYSEHPGALLVGGNANPYETTRTLANEILHVFETLRPNQVRGIPLMSPVILALWDLHGYTDNIRVNARAAAAMVATVDGGDPDEIPALSNGGTDEDAEYTGATYANGDPVESLESGTVIYAPDGRTITVHQPNAPQGVDVFLQASLREIASGVGLSYNVLSGDMGDSSFAQAKLGLIEQSRRITSTRRTVFVPMALDPIWRRFIDAAITARLLPNRSDLYRVRWSDPRQQAADRKDEAEAARLEVRCGFRSLDEVVESDYGRDPDEVRAERAAALEADKAAGVVSDTSPDQTTQSGQLQGSANGTTPAQLMTGG